MKQIFLSGQGQIEVLDAPIPGRFQGGVLIGNGYSLISAGTEGAAITRNSGMRGLYEKVMNSRDRFGQVWDLARSQGVANTAEVIRNKLEDYTPIGYSAAGIALETDCDNLGFRAGDRVACIGTGFANHAEYLAVPKNLVAKIPDGVPLQQAAFGAIACIAMQGLRRLELSPGERVAIVGLGLIGQVAYRLAPAMGYEVIGMDIDDRRAAQARGTAESWRAINTTNVNPVAHVHEYTDGTGIDGVLICASAKVDGLINKAFEMCRRRGRISVVGDIGLGLERAKMYTKELEVRMSCSYGVGRYDPEYELEGRDYPLPYVRWTEGRNLSLFLDLLASRRLSLEDLVSAEIPVDSAKDAYSLLKSGDPSVYGLLLDYKLSDEPKKPIDGHIVRYETTEPNASVLQVGMIGAGAYAKTIHVPNLQKIETAKIRGVASRSGGSAAVVAKKVGAAYAGSVDELLADAEINAVVISTRHASHARFVIDTLKAGKHVFVEKPMATTTADCLKIIDEQHKAKRVVRVGYNRRFAPFLRKMKRGIGPGRKHFSIRVNVGAIGGHWSNTAEEGGRLMGEGVHFFDLANWMMGSTPVAVTAQFMGEVDALNPNVTVTIRYEDGSLATVAYTTVGDTARGKEFFELFGNERSAVVDNYKSLTIHGAKSGTKRGDRNDKGQLGAMAEFVAASRGFDEKPDGFGEGADALAGLWATAITEAAIMAAKENRIIDLAEFIKRSRA